MAIAIEIPNLRYDITMPLFEGRVPIAGVELRPGKGVGGTVLAADSPLRTGDFGLVDLNLGNLLPAVEAGWELIALPVFSKRKPAYTYVYCRTDAGIESPKDLEGKRIGAGRYRSALTIWLRGLLRHRHGVDTSTLHWIVWGGETFPLHATDGQIDRAPDPKKSVLNALFDGEIDAIMTDISDGAMFDALDASPLTKRVFPNYMADDEALFRETGIYTPVHVIAMSKKLDRAHPELAAKLFAAFEQAKTLAYQDIFDDRSGFGVIYLRERLQEQMARFGDLFAHGIKSNQAAIDTFVRFNVEQGMVSRSYTDQELFAASTLDS